MVSVEKATIADFDQVCELARDKPFFSKAENRTLLGTIYQGKFDGGEGYCGYVMKDNGTVVGSIGLIFSRQVVNGEEEKFCNLTSWIVKPEFRSKALALLLPVLQLKDYTVTALSATAQAYAIYNRLGFRELDNIQVVIFPMPNLLCLLSKKATLIQDMAKIEAELLHGDTQLKQIMKDHAGFKCRHLLIKVGEDICYLIYNKLWKKKIPVAVLNFISNPGLLADYIDRVRLHLLWRNGICLMLVDLRLLKGCRVSFSAMRHLAIPFLFRSERLKAEDINNLYSERILLNIN